MIVRRCRRLRFTVLVCLDVRSRVPVNPHPPPSQPNAGGIIRGFGKAPSIANLFPGTFYRRSSKSLAFQTHFLFQTKNVRFTEDTKENDGGDRPSHVRHSCFSRVLSERPQWTSLVEFNVALVAFALSPLSVAWFASYCLRHGGGVFL